MSPFLFSYMFSRVCYHYYTAVKNRADKKNNRKHICDFNKHYLIGIKKILKITCKVKQKSKEKRKKEEKHKSFRMQKKLLF